jgi:hypothetical protein
VWTYTDCAGFSHDWTYTFTIEYEDFTMPIDNGETIACPGELYEPTPPTVYDNCGDEVIPSGPVVSATPACEGDVTYVWTYTDCAGFSHDWTYTFTIELTTAPVIPIVDVVTTVTSVSEAVEPEPPAVTDACGRVVTPVMTVQNDPDPIVNVGIRTYTFTYTDCANNSAVWNYTYIIESGAPEPGFATVECIDDAVEPLTPEVDNTCGDPIVPVLLSVTDNPDPLLCEGTRVYLYNYEDVCEPDNSFIWTFTYTIDLATPPAVPNDETLIVECASVPVDPPAVNDACGNPVTPSLEDVEENLSGSNPCQVGVITYTYRYEDCAGNVSFWKMTHEVVSRTTAPMEVGGPVPTQETVDCIDQAVDPVLPVVHDVCGTPLNYTDPVLITTSAYNDNVFCDGGFRRYRYKFFDPCNPSLVYEFTFRYEVLPRSGPVLVDEGVSCSSLNQDNINSNLADAQSFDATSLEDIVANLYIGGCGGPIEAALTNTTPADNNSDNAWSFDYEFTITDECGNPVICVVTYSGGLIPETIVLDGITVDGIECYGATQTITVENLTVTSTGDLTLIAGQSIHLLPGFSVQLEGYFHGYISDVYCENPTPLVASKEEELPEELNVTELHESFFRVYPNPTTGTFKLQLLNADETSGISVEIFGMMGERVLQQNLFGHQVHEFDLSNLPRGIYVIRVLQGDEFGTERIIKQ